LIELSDTRKNFASLRLDSGIHNDMTGHLSLAEASCKSG
jgi:hypothetical protein